MNGDNDDDAARAGQCKRLEPAAMLAIARLVTAVSDDRPLAEIAAAFRKVGLKTANDSTEFMGCVWVMGDGGMVGGW
jgi:aarF domain-containing kinase